MTLPTRTPISWTPPEGMDFEAWEVELAGLLLVERATPWMIGDCLNAGEVKFGEKYAQAVPDDRLRAGTLRNYKWVANRIEMSRRRDNLAFGHHQEVAPLEPAEQARWLDRAEQEGLSQKALRAALRLLPAPCAPEGSCPENSDNSNPTEPQAEILPPAAQPAPQITFSPQGGKDRWREALLRCWQAGDYEWQRELLNELTLLTIPPSLKRIA